MNQEKELQEKIITHKIIEARVESLLSQRELLMRSLEEMEETMKGLEEMEVENDLLISIGSETYLPCKISEKKVLVEIGANVALEKTFDEGKEILRKRKEKIEASLQKIEKIIEQLSSNLLKLNEEIRNILEKKKAERNV